MSSTIINLYIPRILGNIKRNTIVNTFSNMNIGDIFYIDMYKKINENNNPYYFAFISINLYDNNKADNLKKLLDEKGSTRITYDYGKNHYWEVKKHIPRSMRTRVPSPISVSAIEKFDSELDIINCNKNINSLSITTIFTKKDKDDLEKEYKELENEIKLICNDNWIPIYHYKNGYFM